MKIFSLKIRLLKIIFAKYFVNSEFIRTFATDLKRKQLVD